MGSRLAKHRVALIGTGRVGYQFSFSDLPDNHAEAVAAVKSCELVAGVNRGRERLEDFGARFGVDALFHDHRQMLEQIKPDLCIIATHPELHAQMVEDCAATPTTRAIICEKPMALSLAECDGMIEVCDRNSVLLQINHNRRWHRQWCHAQDLIHDGVIGELFQLTCYLDGGKPDPSWRSDNEGPLLHDLVAWIIPKNILSLVFSTLGVVQMPHKFNAARRHKFDKVQYRVINWAEYNESLRQRGDLTIWVSEEAQSVWSAPRRTSRGGQRRYSDLAIETCLMLRTAYHLGLRQTQGLMGSIGTLMGLDIRVPDYSTLSRRANGVSIAQVMRQAGSVPIHLVVDRTGLKIFGEGEWLAQKHNTKGIRRRWRKLHLGLDLASGAIGCAALTHDNVGDSTALPGLLDQLDAPVTGFLADGAYDGSSTRNLLRQRYGETLDVVIPPPKDAVIRPQSARDATVRDRHLGQIRSNGCMAWQTATGYNQRSRIETQMGRWKSVIGPKLKSRSFSRQITEVQLGRKVLNTMTALGRPVFERIS